MSRCASWSRNAPMTSFRMAWSLSMHKFTVPIAAMLAVALSACTVGPDFVRPTLSVPDRFAEASSTAADSIAPAPDAEFWQGFNDPLLSRLVEQALSSNHDLRIALSRYDHANALLR